MDFSFTIYNNLLVSLKKGGFNFQTFYDFLISPFDKVVILRHDVDSLPKNALKIAEIEANLGIKSTFYFRARKNVFNEVIINKIIELGHEIGYHYENLDIYKGNYEKAFEDFKYNLEKFRKLYPVKTICMHGSPLSKYDNRKLWEKYDYKSIGIIGEPYFDVNWNEVLYLTDTGRKWNCIETIVRDKVKSKFSHLKFSNTSEIIENINLLPKKIMINTHPQRWTNNLILWGYEFISQNLKNSIKKAFFVK